MAFINNSNIFQVIVFKAKLKYHVTLINIHINNNYAQINDHNNNIEFIVWYSTNINKITKGN